VTRREVKRRIDLGSFSEYLRLPAGVYAPVSFVAAILLFAPERLLTWLGLADVANYRRWIGLILIVGVARLVAELGHQLWRHLTAEAKEAKNTAQLGRDSAAEGELKQQRRPERLSGLTVDEKALLRSYVQKNVRARRLSQTDAALHALMGSKILGAASQKAMGAGSAAFQRQCPALI
jgi:hypothetical protein